MIIEHSVVIYAPIGTVWSIFTDLTCWEDWTSVIENVSSTHGRLREGKSFKFCIRPFVFPIKITPVVEELVPHRRIVWAGRKHSISARHEFIFEDRGESVELLSREVFTIGLLKRLFFHLPKKKLHKLSIMMLNDLKHAAENPSDQVPHEDELWEIKSD